MKNTPRWILWELQNKPGQDKPAKVPVSPAGHNIDPHNPINWMTHDEAASHGKPMGFVFVESDRYFFLDLDNCLTAAGWSDRAVALTNRFPHALRETSVSGTGLHVIGRYSGDRPEHGTRCREISGELYTAGRFVAIGQQASGDPEADCTDALKTLVAQYFPPKATPDAAEWGDGPREDWTGPTDDDELISKASRTASMFGGRATFAQLWNADEDALGEFFVDDTRPFEPTAADLALARHLAFWTGCDGDRIERLMRRSGLSREKYDRRDYMDWTIGRAIASTDTVYDRRPEPASEIRPGQQFLTVQEQATLFAGCVYVISRNAIMLPSGEVLKQPQFNAVMPCHEFQRDTTNSITPTKKPWEAYTESLAFSPVIADEACFDPASPWDEVIERGGLRYANTYRPIETPRKKGDPGRFLQHLAKLLPDERDQQIMLAYMAAVVQHKGVKFQWCPLIQGVEGNGKTLLSTALIEAIGERYSHCPQASDISNKFNAWLQGNILICIEDIYVPDSRREIIEVLKPMITNGSGLGIQRKGIDQETARVCCNFMINSNHKDALPKTRNDRRFAVFFTAQQDHDDLRRDGMHTGSGYFPALYSWMRAEGFAIVHDFLASYQIPDELNPATECMRAPDTSSTEQAIRHSLGAREQQLLDLVGERRPGFCEPWISRSAWSAFLEAAHVRMSINAQREALRRLEYIPHPALSLRGRTNNKVWPDGRPADLWVKKDHIAASIDGAAAVAKCYEKAQREEQQCEQSNVEFK